MPDVTYPESYRIWNCRSPGQHPSREIVYLSHTKSLNNLASPHHEMFFLKGGWPDPCSDGVERKHLIRKAFDDHFRDKLDVAWIIHDRPESLGGILLSAYQGIIHGHGTPLELIMHHFLPYTWVF